MVSRLVPSMILTKAMVVVSPLDHMHELCPDIRFGDDQAVYMSSTLLAFRPVSSFKSSELLRHLFHTDMN